MGKDPALFAERIRAWLKPAGWSYPLGKLKRDMTAHMYPFREALNLLAGRGDVRVEKRGRGCVVTLLRWPEADRAEWSERQERLDEEASRRRRRARQKGYRKGRHSAWFREHVLGLPPD